MLVTKHYCVFSFVLVCLQILVDVFLLASSKCLHICFHFEIILLGKYFHQLVIPFVFWCIYVCVITEEAITDCHASLVNIRRINFKAQLLLYPVKHFQFSAGNASLNLVNIHNSSICVTHITESVTNAYHNI